MKCCLILRFDKLRAAQQKNIIGKAMNLKSLFVLAAIGLVSANCFSQNTIKSPAPTPSGSNVALFVLHKIAEVQGGYEVVYPYEGQERPSFAKQLADFEAGDLDVMWTLANRKYEEDYQAIYYPLYYGMFGLRLPIVKNENLHMFRGVKNLNDLKRFKVGQGLGWADTDILQANGLDVVEVTKYPNHFPMLEGERFDYFPRAMHEPWSEVKTWSKYNVTVDPHIVIRYKVGFYFFVKKKDVALIRYLNEGMAKLEENGMHKQIFLDDEEVQMAFRNSNLENRIVIDLANPELTQNTPSDDSGLWLDINNLDAWLSGDSSQKQDL